MEGRAAASSARARPHRQRGPVESSTSCGRTGFAGARPPPCSPTARTRPGSTIAAPTCWPPMTRQSGSCVTGMRSTAAPSSSTRRRRSSRCSAATARSARAAAGRCWRGVPTAVADAGPWPRWSHLPDARWPCPIPGREGRWWSTSRAWSPRGWSEYAPSSTARPSGGSGSTADATPAGTGHGWRRASARVPRAADWSPPLAADLRARSITVVSGAGGLAASDEITYRFHALPIRP